MANKSGIKIRVWREGKDVLARSDALHITTYGKSTKQALENFKEALALTLEAVTESSLARRQALPFELDLGTGAGYGRTPSKSKAVGAC